MRKPRLSSAAAITCGGVLVLSGCRHSGTAVGGVPIPPTHAAAPVQTQIQEIDRNPHIPPAEKAALEAHIAHANGISVDKNPIKGH